MAPLLTCNAKISGGTMKSRTRELLRRALSLRNVVPLLIIIGAFVGTFFPTPFGLQRDQLLLGLLAFLAVDALVERLELLTNIEKDVGVIRESVASRASGKDLLRLRSDFPRLEHLIADANKEIWVSGITLDTMATLVGVFNSKLKEGFRLRFLAISPEPSVIDEVSEYFGGEANELAWRLKANLSTLSGALVSAEPGQVEIRTIGHRPALGYFIVDPSYEQGYMTIQNYLYRMRGSHVYPLLFLSKRTDPKWFDIYLKDFELLWSSATEWKPGP